jgi:hypothetical protein
VQLGLRAMTMSEAGVEKLRWETRRFAPRR